LTPLEKVYARQSQQLDRYHQQLRERDRQEEAATLNLPEMFSKLASFSQTIGQVVEARETGQKTKAAGEEQKTRRKLSAEDNKKRNEIWNKYELDKKGLFKDSEGFEKAVRDSGLLEKYTKEELFGSSPRMQLLRREVAISREADSIALKVQEKLKEPEWNRKFTEAFGKPQQMAALREDIIDEITETWDTSDGLYYAGVEKKVNAYLGTKWRTDKLKLSEIQATKKEEELYGFVNNSINSETRGVAISTIVKNNTIYSDPELPLGKRRQAWDSFFLSTDRGIRSGEIKLTQDELLNTPVKRDDGAIVPLSEFATKEDLNTINAAYNTYNAEVYKQYQAVTKAEIQTAFVSYKQDGDEDARGKALNKYLRNGGKTSDAEYKALENAQKSNPAIAEIEQERIGEIQLTGRPGQYEGEVENMSQVDFDTWEDGKNLYEANREQNGVDKKTSDTFATNLMKADLGLDVSPLGKGLIPGTQTEIRDWISARRDQIYATVYNDPKQDRKTIRKTTDALLKDELTQMGFYAPNDREHPDYGILTSDGQGGYPGWEAQQQSKIEQSKGSNPQRTVRNVLNEFQEHKTLTNLLNNGRGITNAELLAVIDNIKDGKLTAYPPDVLLKAQFYGIQPSDLILFKLEYLKNTKDKGDRDFKERFNLDPENLKKSIQPSDVEIREVIEGINDGRTLLSQYNRLGIGGLSPKQLQRILRNQEVNRLEGEISKKKQNQARKEARFNPLEDTQIGRYNTRS
jgi:hypothetical protein